MKKPCTTCSKTRDPNLSCKNRDSCKKYQRFFKGLWAIPKKVPQFHYDSEGDVMYISFGKPLPCGTIEPEEAHGVLVRYHDRKDKKTLNGITIMDYSARTVSGKYNKP